MLNIPDANHLAFKDFGFYQLLLEIQNRPDFKRWLITVMRDNKAIGFLNCESWDYAPRFAQLLYLNVAFSANMSHHNYVIVVRKFATDIIAPNAPKEMCLFVMEQFKLRMLTTSEMEAVTQGGLGEPNTTFANFNKYLNLKSVLKAVEPFYQQDFPEPNVSYQATHDIVHPWLMETFNALSIGPELYRNMMEQTTDVLPLINGDPKRTLLSGFADHATRYLSQLFMDWLAYLEKHPPLAAISWADAPTDVGLVEFFPSAGDWFTQADALSSLSVLSPNAPASPFHLFHQLLVGFWKMEFPELVLSNGQIPARIDSYLIRQVNALRKNLNQLECADLYSAGLLTQQAIKDEQKQQQIAKLDALRTCQDIANTFFPEFVNTEIKINTHAFWKAWKERAHYLEQHDLQAIIQVGLPMLMTPKAKSKLEVSAKDFEFALVCDSQSAPPPEPDIVVLNLTRVKQQ